MGEDVAEGRVPHPHRPSLLDPPGHLADVRPEGLDKAGSRVVVVVRTPPGTSFTLRVIEA